MLALLVAALAPSFAQEGDEAPGTVTGTAGKGVTFTTADDRLSVTLKTRFQVRASLFAPDADVSEDPMAIETVIRRARISLGGHAYSKDLTYYVEIGLTNQDAESDLRVPLKDANLTYSGLRDLEIRAGQYKVWFGRQRVTSSGSLSLVDRSIVVGELNLDRDVGVALQSSDLGGADGRFGYAVGVYGGDGANRLGESTGLLKLVRLSIRPFGEFDDFVEADLKRRDDPKLANGVNLAHNAVTNRPRSTTSEPYTFARFDYLHASADAMFKWHGLFLQSELIMRRADQDLQEEGGVTEYSRSGHGWYVQAGQMFGPHLELGGRYGDLVPYVGTDPEFERKREMGGGASWYFDGHLLKLQTDYFYLPTGDTLQDGEQVVRAQIQLGI
jgi:hypothetical protein